MDILFIIGAIALLIGGYIALNKWTGGYLSSTREEANKLLEMDEPSQDSIKETIKNLSRFHRDKEAIDLIERLGKKQAQLQTPDQSNGSS